MVKNGKLLNEFNNKFIIENPLNIEKSYQMFEWMADEAKFLNKLIHKDPMEDLEIKIKIARILNCIKN